MLVICSLLKIILPKSSFYVFTRIHFEHTSIRFRKRLISTMVVTFALHNTPRRTQKSQPRKFPSPPTLPTSVPDKFPQVLTLKDFREYSPYLGIAIIPKSLPQNHCLLSWGLVLKYFSPFLLLATTIGLFYIQATIKPRYDRG